MRPFLAILLLAACSSPRAAKPAETQDAIAQPAQPPPPTPRTGGVGAQRSVPPFHAVAAGGIFDVTITVGPAQEVIVTAAPDVIPQVTTEVLDGWLLLDWTGHHLRDIDHIQITISVPQ